MLNDKDIRDVLIEKLTKSNKNHDYRIINELGLCDGEARADIAGANGKLCGYEIKSDRDTLERLSNQIKAYNATFDRITIVVGEKFEHKILSIVPEFWGVEVAYMNRFGRVSIKKVRTPTQNTTIEGESLLELLWKDELKNLLIQQGIDKGLSGKNKKTLKEMAIKNVSFKVIRNYTRETLKSRQGWRFD